MKLKYFILCSLYLLSSCSNNKDENTDPIVGKWHLVSQLVDPGDGSGTFQDVISNRTIEIDENGVVTSNSNLCDLSIEAEGESVGQYSFQDMVMVIEGCSFPYNLSVTLDGEFIDLHYPCFEACICKYKKIN